MTNNNLEEMSLIEHLTELRKRLLWSFLYILIVFIICFYFAERLFAFLAFPLVNLLDTENGQGFIYSFVKVHQPYHPAFKPFIPYTVATIQLDEGPRLLCAMLDLTTEVKIGDRVTPRIERITANESMLTYKLEGS